MKQIITVLAILISGIASAQYNYEYEILYFDEHPTHPSNQGIMSAGIAEPNVRYLRVNDDITDDIWRLEINTGTETIRYKMTDTYARSLENDITEHNVDGMSPTINSYGPFDLEFVRQNISRRGDLPRYTLRVNRMPRTWTIDFESSSNGRTNWVRYGGSTGRWVDNFPTTDREEQNRDYRSRWDGVNYMRVIVRDENGVERQRTRPYRLR